MDKAQTEEKKKAERDIINLFNSQNQTSAEKKDVKVGQSTKHEFDLYEPNKVIGGILCSFVGLLLTVSFRFASNIQWDLSHLSLASGALVALLLRVDILWVVVIGTIISLVVFT